MKKNFKIFQIIFISLIYLCPISVYSEEKIKIGLLVPMTGDNKKLGELIIESARIALKDIDTNLLEIHPKDSGTSPTETLKSAFEFKDMGINIIIGPIFYKNLSFLEEVEDVIFLSLTNKTINLPRNVISSGVNATSQLNTIKKFISLKEIKNTIFLTPKLDYEAEIKKGIKNSKIKVSKHYVYETEPTKLTSQIEKITNYKKRKQNLLDEIKRVENSNEDNKEKIIARLEKLDTIGGINFDSVIIADFEESLKSVATSLIYTDIPPSRVTYITLNQWFDKSLLNEEMIQPIYFPSVNFENYQSYLDKYYENFKNSSNQIAFLSYDLTGLVYYLLFKNNFVVDNQIFYKKNSFKGKIGVFEINKNIITHQLNFYEISEKKIKKIF